MLHPVQNEKKLSQNLLTRMLKRICFTVFWKKKCSKGSLEFTVFLQTVVENSSKSSSSSTYLYARQHQNLFLAGSVLLPYMLPFRPGPPTKFSFSGLSAFFHFWKFVDTQFLLNKIFFSFQKLLMGRNMFAFLFQFFLFYFLLRIRIFLTRNFRFTYTPSHIETSMGIIHIFN